MVITIKSTETLTFTSERQQLRLLFMDERKGQNVEQVIPIADPRSLPDFFQYIQQFSSSAQYTRWKETELSEFKEMTRIVNVIRDHMSQVTGTVYDLIAWKNIFFELFVARKLGEQITLRIIQDFVILISKLYRRNMNLHNSLSQFFFFLFTHYTPPERVEPQSHLEVSENTSLPVMVDKDEQVEPLSEQLPLQGQFPTSFSTTSAMCPCGDATCEKRELHRHERFDFLAYKFLLKMYRSDAQQRSAMRQSLEASQQQIKVLQVELADIMNKNKEIQEELLFYRQRANDLEVSNSTIVDKMAECAIQNEKNNSEVAKQNSISTGIVENKIAQRFAEHLQFCNQKLDQFRIVIKELVDKNDKRLPKDVQTQMEVIRDHSAKLQEKFDLLSDDFKQVLSEMKTQYDYLSHKAKQDEENLETQKLERRKASRAMQSLSDARNKFAVVRQELENYLNLEELQTPIKEYRSKEVIETIRNDLMETAQDIGSAQSQLADKLTTSEVITTRILSNRKPRAEAMTPEERTKSRVDLSHSTATMGAWGSKEVEPIAAAVQAAKRRKKQGAKKKKQQIPSSVSKLENLVLENLALDQGQTDNQMQVTLTETALKMSQQNNEQHVELKVEFNKKMELMKDVYEQRIKELEAKLDTAKHTIQQQKSALVKQSMRPHTTPYYPRAPGNNTKSDSQVNGSYEQKGNEGEMVILTEKQVRDWETRKELILQEQRKKLEAALSHLRLLNAEHIEKDSTANVSPKDKYEYNDTSHPANNCSPTSPIKLPTIFMPFKPKKLMQSQNPLVNDIRRTVYLQCRGNSPKTYVTSVNLFQQIEMQLQEEEIRLQMPLRSSISHALNEIILS